MGIKKTGILLLSLTVLMTSVFLTEQAFAGVDTCEECDSEFKECIEQQLQTPEVCRADLNNCRAFLQCQSAIGGEFIGIETTSVLAAGAQYTAAWMIPVIVSGIGFAIVIARKF